MPKNVTDAELAVLDAIWRNGPSTIREITSALYPDQSASDYATVQKLLERLEGKGCVRRDRTGFAHVFAAEVERSDLIGRRLEDLAEKLGDGSLTSLLVQLVDGGRLTDAERDALRRLLDDPGGRRMNPLLEAALWNAASATLLALLALAAGRFARRPALAHALWLLVFVKLVTPPLYSVPLLPAPAEEPRPAVVEPVWVEMEAPLVVPVEDVVWMEPVPALPPAPAEPGSAASLSWGELALIGWIAGAAVLLTLGAVRAVRFGREICRARPASTELIRECRMLAERLGVRRRVDLRVVPGRVSPLTWVGPGGARILLPVELLGTLDAGEREAVLAHELAHIARRDHLVRWFELLVVSLWWWLPVVWVARRGLRAAEERCCDAWVAWVIPGRSGSYAAALMKTLDFLAGARPASPALASGMGAAGRIERRFRMIIDGRSTARRLSIPARLVLVAFALTVLPGTVGTATAQEAKWPAPPAPKTAGDEYEKRLERLEKLTETLVEELKALRAERAKAAKPGWVRVDAPKPRPDYPYAADLRKEALGALGVKGTTYSWLASDGRLYRIQAANGKVTSVDPKTGQSLWTVTLGKPIYPQGKIQGDWVVFSGKGSEGKRYVVDALKGIILQIGELKVAKSTPEGLRAELNLLREKMMRAETDFANKLAHIDVQIDQLRAERDDAESARAAEAAKYRKAIEDLEKALEKAGGAK